MTTAKNPQQAAFERAAREAGCDESPEAFERLFAKIVPPKPRPKPDTRKSAKTS
jgi:hypothetical protein